MQWSTEQEYDLRAADPAAQHGQPVAGRDRLGERPDARLGQEARVRGRAAVVRRLLRRSREQARPRAAHRQRVRPDAALSRHDAARRPARARDARAAPGRHRRARRRRRGRTSNASASWRRCARSWHRTSTAISGARRATPVTVAAKVRVGLARICVELDAARDRRARERRRCRQRADRGVRGRRQPAVAAHRVPDEHDSLAASHRAGRRSGVAGQGPQRGGTAHLRLGRHRPEPRAGRARRRFARPTPSNGCSAPCAASTRFRTTRSKRACRSSPTASCRSRSMRAARRKEDLGMVVNGVDVSMMGVALRRAVPAAAVASGEAAARSRR